MEIILNILETFFENPSKEYGIRELSRIIKINHTTVRKYLNDLVADNYLKLRQERIYTLYSLENNQKTLNMKLFYNLEKLRKSNLIHDLEKYFDYPTIVLFGSYSTATDDNNSDLDLCIITTNKKEFNTKNHANLINRKISLHVFDNNSWKKLIQLNQNLVNNICNGIVLSGELEVLK